MTTTARASFPINEIQSVTVPARLYDYSLDLAMLNGLVRIRDVDLVKPTDFGRIDISCTPEIRITIKEIVRKYDANQRDCVATLGKFGLSVFQHIYNPGLATLKNNRTRCFFGGKFEQTVKLYGRCEHFFEREAGGRKRMDLYGYKDSIIAPISDNAEFYNLSASDMAQLIICHGIEKWDDLPEDAAKYFDGIINRFAEYAKKFVVETGCDE